MRPSFCSGHLVDTDDLDKAVKAYRSTQCYTDENKHFVVHYHDYVKETNL